MSCQTNQKKFKPTIKTIFTCKGNLSYMLLPQNWNVPSHIAMTMGFISLPLP